MLRCTEDRGVHMNDWTPWKAATIGLAVVITTAAVTGLVVGNWTGKSKEQTLSQPLQKEATTSATSTPRGSVTRTAPTPPRAVARAVTPSPASDVDACNQYAKSAAAASNDTTKDVLTKAVLGGALGAGVGAAGGAVAGGGRGAGKGAAIGGIVGATAGTLFGLNEKDQKDTRAEEAYRSCMRARGHTG
jgi:hypothetical protein